MNLVKNLLMNNNFGYFKEQQSDSCQIETFIMVPLNLTYLHCLQHSFFEHLFNLYYDVLTRKESTPHVYSK